MLNAGKFGIEDLLPAAIGDEGQRKARKSALEVICRPSCVAARQMLPIGDHLISFNNVTVHRDWHSAAGAVVVEYTIPIGIGIFGYDSHAHRIKNRKACDWTRVEIEPVTGN